LEAAEAESPMSAIYSYTVATRSSLKMPYQWIHDVEMHIQNGNFLSNGIPSQSCTQKLREAAISIVLQDESISDEVKKEFLEK